MPIPRPAGAALRELRPRWILDGDHIFAIPLFSYTFRFCSEHRPGSYPFRGLLQPGAIQHPVPIETVTVTTCSLAPSRKSPASPISLSNLQSIPVTVPHRAAIPRAPHTETHRDRLWRWCSKTKTGVHPFSPKRGDEAKPGPTVGRWPGLKYLAQAPEARLWGAGCLFGARSGVRAADPVLRQKMWDTTSPRERAEIRGVGMRSRADVVRRLG